MGAPPRSEVGCERVENSSSMEELEGKTVDRVAMEDRLSIRRASMADSWTVGIPYSAEKDEGLESRCCGGGAEAKTRGRIERKRLAGRNIFEDEKRGYERGRTTRADRRGIYIEVISYARARTWIDIDGMRTDSYRGDWTGLH